MTARQLVTARRRGRPVPAPVCVVDCPHPPARLFCSIVPADDIPAHGDVMGVTCCDCGATWERPLPPRRAMR